MTKVADKERGRAGMLRYDLERSAPADGKHGLTGAGERPERADDARRVVAGARGRPRDRGSRVATASAAAVLVAALAACSAGGGSSRPPSTAAATVTSAPPAASQTLGGQLTDLPADAQVARQQPVRGIVTGLPAGDHAWLVVYPDRARAYWPQKGPLTLNVAGGFRATAVFGSGSTQNLGEGFVLRLVITSASATTRFRAFLAHPGQGLSKLPAGVRTLTKVTVKRS